MLQFYADAFFCQPPVVLGRRLRPYSLGHSFTLDAIQSPFAVGGPVNAFELIGAVLICSMPFAEIVDKINADSLLKDAEAFGKTLDMDALYAEELAKFHDYLTTYDKAAPAISKPSAAGPLPLPWQIVVAWALMDRLPEREVWDMPLTRAMAYHAAWRYEHGDDTLMCEENYNLMKFVVAQRKQLEQQEQAANG